MKKSYSSTISWHTQASNNVKTDDTAVAISQDVTHHTRRRRYKCNSACYFFQLLLMTIILYFTFTLQIHAFSGVVPSFICGAKQQRLHKGSYSTLADSSKFYRHNPNNNHNIIVSKAKIKASQDFEEDDNEYYYNTPLDDTSISDSGDFILLDDAVESADPAASTIASAPGPEDFIWVDEALERYIFPSEDDEEEEQSRVYGTSNIKKIYYTPPALKEWEVESAVVGPSRHKKKHEVMDQLIMYQQHYYHFLTQFSKILQKSKKLLQVIKYYNGLLDEYHKLSKEFVGLEKNITNIMSHYQLVKAYNATTANRDANSLEAKVRFLVEHFHKKVQDAIQYIELPIDQWPSKRPLHGFFDIDAVIFSMEDDEEICRFDLSRASHIYDDADFDANRRLFIFDYQFDLVQLWLASIQLSPDNYAIPTHWIRAISEQNKYAKFREEQLLQRGFNWTSIPKDEDNINNIPKWWLPEEVESANVQELKEYWMLFGGYENVPQRSREAEIRQQQMDGVVDLEQEELNFEEENILAWQKWMEEVYDEEDDTMLEDEMSEEEAFVDEKKVDPWVRDVTAFEKEFKQESEEFKRAIYTKEEYELLSEEPDGEEGSTFRGHLVLACSPSEEDLELSAKITKRMEQEFGKQVFVETRVYGHAKRDDNVYEIWLESWDIDLLHSKRRATFDRDWTGPKIVDDDTLTDLVERIRFLISDDARYSFDFNEFDNLVQSE